MIARIALGDDTLAAPAYWEDTEDLRVLVSYRRELVKDRTAGANRLHADVGKLRPGYQQNIRRLTTHKALKEAMRLLWSDTSPHARVAKQRIRTLRNLDRQINRAIHTVALTQIARPHSEGRRYYHKLITRGKTHREAIRALKRRISDRIWTHLQPPRPAPNLT